MKHNAVLIHRAGSDRTCWDPVMDLLDQRVHADPIDLPGHGQESGPPCETIEQMAEAVLSRAGAQQSEQIVIIGYSMGGAVALQAALDRPEKIAGVVLVASCARLYVTQEIFRLIDDHFEEQEQLTRRMGIYPQKARLLFSASKEVALKDLRACHGFDVEPLLRGLTAPLEMLIGAEDELVPRWVARRTAERAPNAHMQVIEGAGHLLVDERPAIVAKAIERMTSGTMAQ